MAVMLRRWAIGAALGCAAIAIAYLPPEVREDDRADAQMRDVLSAASRANRLAAEIQEAEQALALPRWRDSLLRALARRAPTPEPLLLVDPGLGRPWPQRLRGALDRLWRQVDRPSPEIRVAVALPQRNPDGSLPAAYSLEREASLLPPATDGRACLVLIPWRARRMSDQAIHNWLAAHTAPCVFYAAFGRPGQTVERWLIARSFDLGSQAQWADPAGAPDVDRERWSLWQPWFWNSLYRAGFGTVACAAGRTSSCRALVLDTTAGPGSRTGPFPYGVRFRPRWSARPMAMPLNGEWFLSDLVRLEGREKFVRFWRSESPVDSAFAAAFGRDIAEWTRDWQRLRNPSVRIGPRARWDSVLLSLLFGAVALLVGAVVVGRRQVA